MWHRLKVCLLVMLSVWAMNACNPDRHAIGHSMGQMNVNPAIAGKDSNQDGVRDDVMPVIDQHAQDNRAAHDALSLIAIGHQRIALASNAAEANSGFSLTVLGMSCLFAELDQQQWYGVPQLAEHMIRDATVNTPLRLRSYEQGYSQIQMEFGSTLFSATPQECEKIRVQLARYRAGLKEQR